MTTISGPSIAIRANPSGPYSTPLSNGSLLQVSVHGSYDSSPPLPHPDKPSAQLGAIVPVPISDLRPFSNSFLMRCRFAIPKRHERPDTAQDTAPNNLPGAIL